MVSVKYDPCGAKMGRRAGTKKEGRGKKSRREEEQKVNEKRDRFGGPFCMEKGGSLMDAREQAFVHEYIINGGNAYQAALTAGYSKNTANHAAQWIDDTTTNHDSRRLPYKQELAEAIQAELKKLESEKIADETEILQYLTSVMRREKGEATVVVLHEEETKWVPNPDTGRNVKQTIKKEIPQIVELPTKISDANKAAELLGKVRGLFRERVAVDIATVVLMGYYDVED